MLGGLADWLGGHEAAFENQDVKSDKVANGSLPSRLCLVFAFRLDLPSAPLFHSHRAQRHHSHQVMRQHVPQHDGSHLRAAAHAHLVEPAVARLGVDALGGGGRASAYKTY